MNMSVRRCWGSGGKGEGRLLDRDRTHRLVGEINKTDGCLYCIHPHSTFARVSCHVALTVKGNH